MTAVLYLLFLAVASLFVWRMSSTGEISGLGPRTRRERIRLLWVIVGVVNFLAFLAHVLMDKASAFPGGGRFSDGHYLVREHGRDILFTPSGYLFSYWHGLFFVLLHLACTIMCWRLRKQGDSRHADAGVSHRLDLKSQPSIQQKVVLDVLLVAVAVVLLVSATASGIGSQKDEPPSVFAGIYLIYLGFLFLLSYFISYVSFVLGALRWVCEHFSHPRGRHMAFFYFGLSVLLGGCLLLSACGLLRLSP
jgi:hypothetical protein